MSKYDQFQTVMTEPEHLCAALRELGFQPEYHEQPVHLEGYHGDKRQETAHVVIPRRQVGGASNDIGFFREPDGQFRAIVSEFDQRSYGKLWLGKVSQFYKEKQTVATAEQKGYTFLGREMIQTAKGPTVQLRFGVR